MDDIRKAARLKVVVAVEKFKSELATIGMDEAEIQDALDSAIDLCITNSMHMVEALREVADAEMMKRTRQWASGTKGVNSSTAPTKES